MQGRTLNAGPYVSMHVRFNAGPYVSMQGRSFQCKRAVRFNAGLYVSMQEGRTFQCRRVVCFNARGPYSIQGRTFQCRRAVRFNAGGPCVSMQEGRAFQCRRAVRFNAGGPCSQCRAVLAMQGRTRNARPHSQWRAVLSMQGRTIQCRAVLSMQGRTLNAGPHVSMPRTSGAAKGRLSQARFRVCVFRGWAQQNNTTTTTTTTKIGQNTKTLKLAKVGQHSKTLKLAKVGLAKVGQDHDWPKSVKKIGQSRFGQSRSQPTGMHNWRPDGNEESERDKKCWIGFGRHRNVQDLALIQEEVSDGHHGNTLILGPQENQGDQPTWPPIDECRWRHQEILPSVSEKELEEVNGHEREQHQSNDGQIQSF